MTTLAKVTGIDPVHTHCYSTLYRGKRYDINTINGKVYAKRFSDRIGSYTVEITTNQSIIKAVTLAVNAYNLNKE